MTAQALLARVPEAVLADLKARYAEPQRHYHVWAHIEGLLGWFDDREAVLHDPEAVLVAILFHDAIYDPTRSDNEMRSAQLLGETSLPGWNADSLGHARHMIEATARHLPPADLAGPKAHDLTTFLDMDLSILGARPEVFANYDAAIRREYAHVPPPLYRAARRMILQGFLERPALYLSDWGRTTFEDLARLNLADAVARLEDMEA